MSDAADTVQEPSSATPYEPGTKTSRARARVVWGEPLWRLVGVVFTLLALSCAVVIPTALRSKGMSVFDETTHVDYAWQISHGHIIEKGDVTSREIVVEEFCRGSARLAPAQNPTPLCGHPNAPARAFLNYNYGHPPLYYLITGVIARSFNHFTAGHFITYARLVGIGWLFAGMLVLYFALRRFCVGWPIALASSGLVALTPMVWYFTSTVTNDAAAVLCGAAALFTLARISVDGKLGWKIPGLLAFLAAGTKVLNALMFLVLAAGLVVWAFQLRRENRAKARQLLYIVIAIVAAFVLMYVGWQAFQHFRGDPNYKNPAAGASTAPVKGLPFNELLSTSFSRLSELSSYYLPPLLDNQLISVWLRLWGPLSLACSGVLLAANPRWSGRFNVAWLALAGVLAFPLIVELQSYGTDGRFFPAVTPRYGITAIPALIAAIAIAVDQKRLQKWFAPFAGFSFIVAMFTVSH
jgi:hypothetical protein